MVIDMKIKPATIARTAVLALALANQVLSVAGLSPLPIDSATLEPWVTTGLTTAAAVWAWWKNNSFTPEAIRADELLKEMRG
jgi:SPP1 family holin